MSRNLLSSFGSPAVRVRNALNSLQKGNGILVVDDENRENEGDLIFSTASLTDEQMALLIRECSGIVCLCLTAQKASSLRLRPMVENNTSPYGTAFTISIEAAGGVSTGVSASDRVTTVKAATADDAEPEDLRHPGHVFPLVAKEGGVMERPGHTEATVDMMKLAGLPPSGVLCELTNNDGSMARLPEIVNFAGRHAFPVVAVKDIIAYRRSAVSPALHGLAAVHPPRRQSNFKRNSEKTADPRRGPE
ncbi:MAG: 3,4-dihydroxy-2-butanone-4-phosphate synthase [Desulfovibrio sp.]|nr:3,4-dihydroxy-2-butanone-4-phosphate synthase [Desulfovibrio sp.]